MTVSVAGRGRDTTAVVVIAVVLVGVNLRAALTGVGPLLPNIVADTGMSAAWGGLLTALPLVAFAVLSPLAARMAQQGARRLVAPALAVLLIGLLVRSIPGLSALFLGTVILSAAIAFANVLLPSIVRGSVPEARITTVTAGYATAMTAAAATASGIAVPLADHLPGGWRTALAAWALPAAVALVAWRLPGASVRRRSQQDTVTEGHARIPWRSGVAWQVSLFFGLQSLGFYATIAWLPSILRDNGITAREAGFYLFGFQLIGLLALNAVPLLPRALRVPRVLAAAASLLNVASVLLLAFVPRLAPLAVVGTGIGAGICLVLAMSFQSERAADAAGAAALAGMAQSVGYLVAAVGPLLLGLLHAATGGWAPALITLALLTAVQAVVGYGAGRARTVT
ncbi:MFS transporter [Nocardia mexicana]|uniref:CP family cyanate transporter-like MFS transporter n=1 Tax=Nocardia mexicana TaxID=279262 RepID=A0A370HA94_9NOCA|nr:MFS transporter [Nocardia mexicana]RDI53439.1 CP family cyanate transporter-like MFS transporter [Nocardia mexicana]